MSTPLDGAATPAVAREFRMFSTEAAVRAVQSPHASAKQLAVTLAGFQLSKTPAGKVVRAEQPFHAQKNSVPKVIPVALKEVMEVQFLHVWWNVVPAVRAMAGKEVSAVQPYHVLVKLVPADRSSAGKVARAVQPSHV